MQVLQLILENSRIMTENKDILDFFREIGIELVELTDEDTMNMYKVKSIDFISMMWVDTNQIFEVINNFRIEKKSKDKIYYITIY